MARPLLQPLPDQTQPRIKALVERSAPDPTRPHLAPEIEERLAPVERRLAACYASMEDVTDQLRQLSRRLHDRIENERK